MQHTLLQVIQCGQLLAGKAPIKPLLCIPDGVLQKSLDLPGVELPFAYTVLLCPLVVIWYILTEAGSIIENAGALGAPVPGWLRKMIAALEQKVEEAGDNLDIK